MPGASTTSGTYSRSPWLQNRRDSRADSLLDMGLVHGTNLQRSSAVTSDIPALREKYFLSLGRSRKDIYELQKPEINTSSRSMNSTASAYHTQNQNVNCNYNQEPEIDYNCLEVDLPGYVNHDDMSDTPLFRDVMRNVVFPTPQSSPDNPRGNHSFRVLSESAKATMHDDNENLLYQPIPIDERFLLRRELQWNNAPNSTEHSNYRRSKMPSKEVSFLESVDDILEKQFGDMNQYDDCIVQEAIPLYGDCYIRDQTKNLFSPIKPQKELNKLNRSVAGTVGSKTSSDVSQRTSMRVRVAHKPQGGRDSASSRASQVRRRPQMKRDKLSLRKQQNST
jgi:hypothetical protein